MTNGLRALWAGLAAASFALLARRMRAPFPFFLACAFTSAPVVFVAGTSTLDARGSLTLGTTALRLARGQHAVLAGVAVGIAAGMRPTGILFALPVFAMLRGRGALIALGFSLVVFALGYAPALLAAGARTIGYYDLGYPALSLVVKKAPSRTKHSRAPAGQPAVLPGGTSLEDSDSAGISTWASASPGSKTTPKA